MLLLAVLRPVDRLPMLLAAAFLLMGAATAALTLIQQAAHYIPGHVVAYYDPGNGTTVRLPDPEWDRIDELTAKLDDLRARVVELESELNEHSTAITGHGPLTGV